MTASRTTGATERQASFIRSLLDDRSPHRDDKSMTDVLAESGVDHDAFLANIADRRQASNVIDTLLSYPKVSTASGTSATSTHSGGRAAADPPVGVHLVDGDVVVKVQKSRTSGRAYAKRLVVNLNPDGSRHSQAWEYVARGDLFRKCSEATLITVEQAAAFGHRTGVCAVCGKDLTVTESIDRGIGPVCFRNLGGF